VTWTAGKALAAAVFLTMLITRGSCSMEDGERWIPGLLAWLILIADVAVSMAARGWGQRRGDMPLTLAALPFYAGIAGFWVPHAGPLVYYALWGHRLLDPDRGWGFRRLTPPPAGPRPRPSAASLEPPPAPQPQTDPVPLRSSPLPEEPHPAEQAFKDALDQYLGGHLHAALTLIDEALEADPETPVRPRLERLRKRVSDWLDR
jgi:hypothetical protein